ncbi:hypothetical protein ACJ73_08544 [Blastomyces percursus]|uniref:Uncharacterized protein n=1 Tax=Blastomyces percursus TaxID=1658174 RepID=A0A1J9QXS3_9EURO|nr:hypothetical protein ACJ73_08544 [Blastomyces percursus]
MQLRKSWLQLQPGPADHRARRPFSQLAPSISLDKQEPQVLETLHDSNFDQAFSEIATLDLTAIDLSICEGDEAQHAHEAGRAASERSTRVWEKQLSNAGAKISRKDLERLLSKSSNGRQIKNIAQAAFALAKEGAVTITHIETALKCAEEFDQDFHGTGAFDNMRAYT